jgi:hypothetical protein
MPRNDRIENRTDMLHRFARPHGGSLPSEGEVEAAIAHALAGRGIRPADVGTVTPYVNDSRWVADCVCGSGMACSPGVDRTTCVECGSRYVIAWGDEAERSDVEAVLLARPNWRNRHWRPGEKVADLVAENAAHGDAVPEAFRTGIAETEVM